MWIPNASATPATAAPPPTQVDGGPVCTVAPGIAGTAKVGHFLNVVYGTWTYRAYVLVPRIIFSYQWKRGGVAISGETDPIYQITSADIGSVITVDEIATDFYGTTIATTVGTAVVTADDRTVVTAESLGLKSTQTTGSITSGSNQLTVASATGFAVNDPILVEIGTEAGLGLRGTVGVGGTWPALAYANAAAMNADSSKAANTYAYLQDTGKVYRCNGGASWSEYSSTSYYWNIVLPLAMRTTITAIDGNVLTLAVNASATATNANVYFDNAPRAKVIGNGFTSTVLGDNKVVTFGAGIYAFGDFWLLEKHNNMWYKGAGKTQTLFKSPRGVPSISVQITSNSIRTTITDIGFIGNNTDEGSPPTPVSGTSNPAGWRPTAVYTQNCTSGFFQDIATENCWQAFSNSSVPDAWCRRWTNTHVGQRIYIQWAMQWSDTSRGGSIDCTQTNQRLMASHETFRSSGVRFYRFTGYNANASCNTSGNFLWQDCRIENDPQLAEPLFQLLQGTPMQDCNANIGNTSGGDGLSLPEQGGEFRNYTLIQKSYYTYQGQKFDMIGFIVAPAYKGVHVTGGSYDAPDWQSGITNSPRAYTSDASHQLNSLVNFRVKNKPNEVVNTQNTGINFTSATGGVVVNCVADTIRAAIISGNQTRAEFAASGGNLARTTPPAGVT